MKKPSILFKDETSDRQEYFVEQYLQLAGDTSNIKDLSSFKDSLESAYSKDASLSNFIANFSEEDYNAFFKNSNIQGIINSNLSPEERLEYYGRIPERYTIPERQIQVKKIDNQIKSIEPSRVKLVSEYKTKSGKIINPHFRVLWNREEKDYLRGLKKLNRNERTAKFQQKYSYHSQSSIDSQYSRTFKRQLAREKRRRK